MGTYPELEGINGEITGNDGADGGLNKKIQNLKF